MTVLKKTLFEILPTYFGARLESAVFSANQAREAATDSESVAETKYDTFGLENSYLAHGQSKRVFECQDDLRFFRSWQPKQEHDEVIGVGSLVEIEFLHGSSQLFLLVPRCGGNRVKVGDVEIQLVSPDSPLGNMLIGRAEGDEIKVMQSGKETMAEVVEIHI